MTRRLAALLVLIFTAFAAILPTVGHAFPGASSASGPAKALARTTVVRLRPVTAHGHLKAGYRVTHRRSGASCQAGSEATGNAYRCFAGNGVYDPCWVTANPAFVDCLGTPYSHRVARLHVTKGYDNGGGLGSASAAIPWGLRVVGGHRATLLQGASGAVGGRRINYLQHGFKLVLIGNVDKSHPVWRIREARRLHGSHYKVLGWVDLATAWFGLPSRKG